MTVLESLSGNNDRLLSLSVITGDIIMSSNLSQKLMHEQSR